MSTVVPFTGEFSASFILDLIKVRAPTVSDVTAEDIKSKIEKNFSDSGLSILTECTGSHTPTGTTVTIQTFASLAVMPKWIMIIVDAPIGIRFRKSDAAAIISSLVITDFFFMNLPVFDDSGKWLNQIQFDSGTSTANSAITLATPLDYYILTAR